MARKINIKQEVMSIEEMHEKFMNFCNAKNLTERTLKGYQNLLKDYTYDAITIENIEDYICKLKAKGNNVNSVNCYLRGIRVFAYFCMQRKYIPEFKIHLLKANKEVKEIYTNEEIRILVVKPKTNSWCQWRNWAAINFLVGTGARVSTCINIRIKDVDFESNKVLYIHNKNGKQQYVPLSPKLKEVLEKYLSLWEHTQEDWLFPNQDNVQLTPSGFKQLVRKYNLAHGIEKTSVHLFRHTFATNYILNGGSPFLLKEILGHSDMSMVNHYLQLVDKNLQENIQQFSMLDRLYD